MRGSGLASRGQIGLTLAAACAVVAAYALWPTGAAAARPRQVPINVTGSLTYVWHGDPAAGCASEGVCGIRGALVISQLQSDSLENLRRGNKSAFLDGPGTARVRRDVGSGAPAECLDSIDEPLMIMLSHSGGRLEAVAAPPDISGRCAGPLPTELSRLALPASRTREGGYDLRGTVPFGAGPFHGQLISTVVLHPGHPSSGGFGSSGSSRSGGGGTGVSGRPPRRLFEVVQLTYGVTPGTQSLQFDFSGDSGPFCETLDDCGALGRLIFGLSSQTSVLQLGAARPVHSRQNARQIIRAFRRDPTAFTEDGFAQFPRETAETFTWSGGITCRDTETSGARADPVTLLLAGGRSASGQSLEAVVQVTGAEDVVRTHCPGPDHTDLLGEQGVLARGSLAVDGLLQHHQVLDLTRLGSFAADGYVGRRSGELELDLSLRRVGAETRASR